MTTSDVIALLSLALTVILALTARDERRRREAVEERVRRADYNPILVKSLRIEGLRATRPGRGHGDG